MQHSPTRWIPHVLGRSHPHLSHPAKLPSTNSHPRSKSALFPNLLPTNNCSLLTRLSFRISYVMSQMKTLTQNPNPENDFAFFPLHSFSVSRELLTALRAPSMRDLWVSLLQASCGVCPALELALRRSMNLTTEQLVVERRPGPPPCADSASWCNQLVGSGGNSSAPEAAVTATCAAGPAQLAGICKVRFTPMGV